MKKIEIFGDDRWPEYTKVREGCRGIVISDGKILLSYERKVDQYLIPGGGIEEGESLSDCCIRELMEETGIIVNPRERYLTLDEYYHEYYFLSHYFVCDVIGECERQLTKTERENGLEPVWVDFDKALNIFAEYESYKTTNEIRYGAYYREWLALSEYKKL